MSPQSIEGESVLLIEAYELADDPKPSLGKVITLIRGKHITATEDTDGFYRVPSLDYFNDQLNEWKRTSRWSTERSYNVVPNGHVTIISFCREHVAPDEGRDKRLWDGKTTPPRFSSWAREYLKAGDCSEAQIVGGGVWAAPPAAVRAWLKSRFQIYVR